MLIYPKKTDLNVPTANDRLPVEGDLKGEYGKRLADRQAARDRWGRLEDRIADARLGVFCAGLVLAFFIYWTNWFGWPWLLVPLVPFVALVVVHEPIRRRSRRAGRAADFYSRGLARMEDRWAGTGVAGSSYLDLNHPYAADLDLFGEGSLFERLCTARTRSGEETLAAWLLAPAAPETIRERHEAVVELRPRLDLREDLRASWAPTSARALIRWRWQPGAKPRKFSRDWVSGSARRSWRSGVFPL